MVCAFACAGLLLLGACAPAASKGESAEGHFGAGDTQPPRGVEPAAPIAPTAGSRAPAALPFSTGGWKTDFTRYSGSIEEIRSGGPPRDGIPPIDQPRFATPFEADAWLSENEPVISLELNGEARAYPLQILIWHEIVNDALGGVPVAVTFCPLCNSAVAFDRRVEGVGTLRFGTTGNLRYSDLVMWSDDPGESWWQQITGEAIVGALTGTRLRMLPASIVSYADFKTSFPRGQVLSRETGHVRSYGANPYVGYDDVESSPFLFSGTPDGRLRPMERVVTVELNGETVAYPYSLLQGRRVVEDQVGGTPIIVIWSSGTASALDRGSIGASRDVGGTGVFRRALDARQLSFTLKENSVVDRETGSSWDLLGQAVAGPLAGRRLEPVVHGDHFWFAWAVFKPQTRVLR